ncbi:RNA-binding S4 domain-containing protein [Pseudochelatococcus sp. G4_1912]|uniref:RNA-binding S4 domain-containing protein n=1 Tax=Pseudochelatococcus sp. G4_1912 TaxID=3114288 RepID=UPI0039C6F624
MPESEFLTRQRLDKWLWHARMARTRTLAAKLVREGHVRFHGQRIMDPAKPVHAGDILTLALAHATMVIKVQGFAQHRGSAPEAQQLYQIVSTSLVRE